MSRAIHPDWYRWPHPDDDPRMIGSYPETPITSYQTRDPHVAWDDPNTRRNYGETIPEDFEVMSPWSFDQEHTFGAAYILLGFGSFFATMYGLHRLFSLIPNPYYEYTNIGLPKKYYKFAKEAEK